MDVITVKNLSKRYTLYPTPKEFFREFTLSGERSSFDVKWAVRNIDLSIPGGQTCALIGMNGSGKSTLLGLISGIISPTTGAVEVIGKIASMLELGAGFRPELSAKENIFLNAGILGLSKNEINRRFEEIIAFSELGDHVDKPIRTFSSGMMLRLGFSIAVHVNFDILLIDEILSVGDLLFKRKCISKMRQFKQMGKTIILSSHSLADVAALCDRILLLDEGRIVTDGPAEEVLRQYWEKCEREQNRIHQGRHPFKPQNLYGEDMGDVKITGVRFLNGDGKETDTFRTGDAMTVRIGFFAHKEVKNPLFRVQLFRNDGLWVHGANTYRQDIALGTVYGLGEIELIYDSLNLLEADYYVSVGIWPDEYTSFIADVAYDLHEMSYIIHVSSSREDGGGIVHNPFRWNLITSEGRNGVDERLAKAAKETCS